MLVLLLELSQAQTFSQKKSKHLHSCFIPDRQLSNSLSERRNAVHFISRWSQVLMWLSGRAPAAMIDYWVGGSKSARLFSFYKRIQMCQFIENPNSLCCRNPYYMGCYGCVILSIILTVLTFAVYLFILRGRLVPLIMSSHVLQSLADSLPLSPTYLFSVPLSETSKDSVVPIREWRSAGF